MYLITTHPYLQVKHPPREWRKLGDCQKVIKHRPEGGRYTGVAVNSEGLVIVTDERYVHLLSKEGTLERSIDKGKLGDLLPGVAFDLKGNFWVTDWDNHKVIGLTQDGQLLQTILHASSESDRFNRPYGVTGSTEGLIYICDRNNYRVTVFNEEGNFLFAFGLKGSGPGCFGRPLDTAFGSDGLLYVTDGGNQRVCVWSKEGTFQRDFKTKYVPTYIAATSDNHLLITSYRSHMVMVYTLEGAQVHEFGGQGSGPGKFEGPKGICVDNNGLVRVADIGNNRVLIF